MVFGLILALDLVKLSILLTTLLLGPYPRPLLFLSFPLCSHNMPETQECHVHYQHAHHMLVEELGLGIETVKGNWILNRLWIDATEGGCGRGKGKKGEKNDRNEVPELTPGPTTLHAQGYMDKVIANCKVAQGQQSHQTSISPPSLYSPISTEACTQLFDS